MYYFLYIIFFIGSLFTPDNSISQQIVQLCHFNETKKQPSWVYQKPSDSDYYYGIGIASIQKSYSSQKRLAELNARNELALQIQAKVESEIEVITTGSELSSKSKIYSKINQSTHAILRNATIVDQWMDSSNCLIYVLAKIRKDSIK